MSYKITISNPGNHFCNPLLKLRGNEYATREEACEAIYAALHDVIDSAAGCEMIDRERGPFWRACNERGDAHENLEDRSSAQNRADNMGDGWEADFDGDAYESECHSYILREGYATEDGVSATVEEVVEGDVDRSDDLSVITSYKSYPANVTIFTDGGSCDISTDRGRDYGGATWTDEEAIADARVILRDHGIDDTTADHYLVSLIASQFPRDAGEEA